MELTFPISKFYISKVAEIMPEDTMTEKTKEDEELDKIETLSAEKLQEIKDSSPDILDPLINALSGIEL